MADIPRQCAQSSLRDYISNPVGAAVILFLEFASEYNQNSSPKLVYPALYHFATPGREVAR